MRKRFTDAERLQNHLDRLCMTPEAAAWELEVEVEYLTAILAGKQRAPRMLWLALRQLWRDEIRRANKTCDHIVGDDPPQDITKNHVPKPPSAVA